MSRTFSVTELPLSSLAAHLQSACFWQRQNKIIIESLLNKRRKGTG
jgi:hypothetical protein